MRKLSELILENQSKMAEIEAANTETEENKVSDSVIESKYFELLKEYGVETIADLDESKVEEFETKLLGMLESVETETTEIVEAKVNEEDINSKEDFEKYAKAILKKAHGDDYDEAKAQKTIDGILADTKDDFGAAIGKLTAGMNESVVSKVNESQSQLLMDFANDLDNLMAKYKPSKFGDVADTVKDYHARIEEIVSEIEEFSSDPTLD